MDYNAPYCVTSHSTVKGFKRFKMKELCRRDIPWSPPCCSKSAWSLFEWPWLCPFPFPFLWLWPCPCELRPPWLWPWPDWWRVRAMLFFLKRIHKSIFKKYQSKSAGTQQLPLCLEIINIHKKAHVITFFFKKLYKIWLFHSHDVRQHSTPRGNEHDGALDGVVVADEALHSQINQHSRYQPDGPHWQQRTQDLCMGEEIRRGGRNINQEEKKQKLWLNTPNYKLHSCITQLGKTAPSTY